MPTFTNIESKNYKLYAHTLSGTFIIENKNAHYTHDGYTCTKSTLRFVCHEGWLAYCKFKRAWRESRKQFDNLCALEQRIARYTRGEAVVKARIFHAKAEKLKRTNFYVALLVTVVLQACAPVLQGHPLYAQHVTNFVRPIEPTVDFEALKGWIGVLNRQPVLQHKGVPSYDVMKTINEDCNKKAYAVTPEWPTPAEFTAAKSGDCKGFAICKYYKLRTAGFSANQLNLWSGDYAGHPHLVLVVSVRGIQYVLDIVNPNLPQAQEYFYNHFQPSYRFNEFGWDTN